jgi:DNA-directed RNA polymerase subunit H (RpoH/RPB5)
MDGTYTGVVDRIEDGEIAVILLEEDGQVIEQLDVAADRLPEPARTDGGVLSVTLEDGEIVSMEYRPETTRDRRESTQEKLDRLSKRLSDREE